MRFIISSESDLTNMTPSFRKEFLAGMCKRINDEGQIKANQNNSRYLRQMGWWKNALMQGDALTGEFIGITADSEEWVKQNYPFVE
jgi:hypothetical protein